MEKLNEILEVLENNNICMIFKIKKDKRLDLIKLGYFNGNEDMIRITKQGSIHTITIFYNDNTCFDYNYGSSTTCVSDRFVQIKWALLEYIKKYYNINLY